MPSELAPWLIAKSGLKIKIMVDHVDLKKYWAAPHTLEKIKTLASQARKVQEIVTKNGSQDPKDPQAGARDESLRQKGAQKSEATTIDVTGIVQEVDAG